MAKRKNRRSGVNGLWNWVPTTQLGWVLSVAAVGAVIYAVVQRKKDIATAERSIAAERQAEVTYGPCPGDTIC